MKEVHVYLWNGSGVADPMPVRVAFVRERFSAIMASNDPEIPPGAFDPLIEHVAGMLARLFGAPVSARCGRAKGYSSHFSGSKRAPLPGGLRCST